MTAQSGEKLIYNGEEISMATEPLNQYLKKRIKFIWHRTDCWRGYFGKWEVKNNKLYLIGLKAFIEGGTEVDLTYLFPGQNLVFANWFNGEIRIPQGEILDFVHMGYASLHDKDLILVFENGVLIKQYEIDNTCKYQERLKQKKEDERQRPLKEAMIRKEERVITYFAILIFLFLLFGICIGIFYLIKWDTILGYIISAILACSVIFFFFIAIRNRLKK